MLTFSHALQQIRDAQLRQNSQHQQQQRIGPGEAARVELFADDAQHGRRQDQHCGSGLRAAHLNDAARHGAQIVYNHNRIEVRNENGEAQFSPGVDNLSSISRSSSCD